MRSSVRQEVSVLRKGGREGGRRGSAGERGRGERE